MTDSRPLISVMIPIYNVSKYLERCLQSVIKQTYNNIEILLYDDGSTDGSEIICDKFAIENKNVTVFHFPNRGQAHGRNFLIEHAKGEYLVFVDSDDVVAPDYVEVLYNLVKKYHCKIAVSVLQTFHEGDQLIERKRKYEEELLTPAKAVEWMNYQVKFDTWPVCKLYHRSIFDSGIRYPEGKIFEDFAITYLLLFESDKVAYCNRATYFYLLRDNSTEGEKFSEKKMDGALEVLHSFEEHKDLLQPIIRSYQCRMVSFACHLLLKMPENYKGRDIIVNLLKDNRKTVLLDKHARPKARIASLISYLGFPILKWAFSFTDRRKMKHQANTPPRISIVVAAYNVSSYISQCIESIWHQTYSNWELLLMVGGQDDTIKICDEYATKDERIKSIHDNKGLVQARNSGYNHATGDWITYVDGDDWVDTDLCKNLAKEIEANPNLDIIYWRYIEELGNKSIDKWKDDSTKRLLYDENGCKELARRVLIYKYGLSDGVCKLINMDYARKYGIYHDPRLVQGSEGVEFSLRAFYYAKSALYINKCFYHYRYIPTSISHKVDEENTKFLADCYKVIWEDIQSFENKDSFISAFYERTVYMLIAIAMNTYFSPRNSNSIIKKVRHYSKVINDSQLFKDSIKFVNTENMDIYRKIVVVLLRLHCYLLLDPIARAKQMMLRLGYYNY